MNDQVGRRVADQDPADVLTPEVLALLKLCGGLRSTDTQRTGRAHRRAGPADRRRGDRRHKEAQSGASVASPGWP
jgi:hypothetical protein